MSGKTMACPVCSSEELSPETHYARFENHARFKHMGKMGTFVRKDLKLGPDRVRFCLECGYVLMFADKEDIRLLREALKKD